VPASFAVRGVHASAKGKYQVKGKYSYTTVRGTIWVVTDRCDGTLTAVTQGKVDVYDLAKRKHVLIPAGASYLARRP
jgi:hypothetical protein